MNWILWTILLSCGCIYVVFLVSCLLIAKDADEKFDRLGPPLNFNHEGIHEHTFVNMHTRFHAGSNPISHAREIETLSKEG